MATANDVNPSIGRELIRSFDARVSRATRTRDLAQRWTASGHLVWTFRSGHVLIDGKSAGAAGDTLGSWPRLLWQAGLRALKPRPDLTEQALDHLAATLADLTDSESGARALRRWLWGGACYGFHLDLGPANWQRHVRLPASPKSRAAIDGARAQTVEELARRAVSGTPLPLGVMAKLTQFTPAVAMTKTRELADSSEAWARGALASGRGSDESEQQSGEETAQAAEAENSWMSTPPSTLVPVLREQMDRRTSLESLALWGTFATRTDHLATAVCGAITMKDVGRAAGRTMTLDPETLTLVSDLLESRHPFGAGVVSGLLERAKDPRSADALARVVDQLGLHRVWQACDLSGITDVAARGLALVLKRLDAGPTQWADLIGVAPPEVAAWILTSAPPSILSRVGGALRRQLLERPGAELAPLIKALITVKAAVPLRALGEALMERRGEGWPPAVMPEVFQALLTRGMGETTVVPLFLDKEVDEDLRLLALRSLHGHPELLREASKFRLGELMEPPRIQSRLKAARKELKASQ